jgi:hypothetical protein
VRKGPLSYIPGEPPFIKGGGIATKISGPAAGCCLRPIVRASVIISAYVLANGQSRSVQSWVQLVWPACDCSNSSLKKRVNPKRVSYVFRSNCQRKSNESDAGVSCLVLSCLVLSCLVLSGLVYTLHAICHAGKTRKLRQRRIAWGTLTCGQLQQLPGVPDWQKLALAQPALAGQCSAGQASCKKTRLSF